MRQDRVLRVSKCVCRVCFYSPQIVWCANMKPGTICDCPSQKEVNIFKFAFVHVENKFLNLRTCTVFRRRPHFIDKLNTHFSNKSILHLQLFTFSKSNLASLAIYKMSLIAIYF